MHKASALAALWALGAVAIPGNHHAHLHKRDEVVVTQTQVSVVTQVVQAGSGQGYDNGNDSRKSQLDQQNDENRKKAADQLSQNPQYHPSGDQGTPSYSSGKHHYKHQQGSPTPQYTPSYQPDYSPAPKAQGQTPSYPQGQQGGSSPSPQPKGQTPSYPQGQQPGSSTPAAASTPSSTPSGGSGASSGTGSKGSPSADYGSQAYIDRVLAGHNCHRANHSAPALTWDQSLADAAKAWGSKCTWGHKGKDDGYPAQDYSDGYGQNIACGSSDDCKDPASITSNLWYNSEAKLYNGGSFSEDAGHYTQVIWKNTKQVGCWTGKCNQMQQIGDQSNAWYTVCNYGPAGNVEGQFQQNVLPSTNSVPFTSTV